MTSLVKKGDKIAILLNPSVNENDMKEFVEEVNRITDSPGHITIKLPSDFKGILCSPNLNG